MGEPIQCTLVEEGLDEAWGTPGAMFWWNHQPRPNDPAPRPAPHLAVFTPGGIWCIDCPSTEPPHAHWQREGEPPHITASPSIVLGPREKPLYHGWLRDGILADA